MSKLVTFAVSELNELTPEEIEDSQFQKIHFRIYSTALNAHGYIMSLNVLKKYANTIQGKPILTYYMPHADNGNGDFAGHEDSSWAQETAVGFFPNDCKITYEKDPDGTVFMCADGYIWTVYYDYVVDVFKNNDGSKGVSSELYIIDSKADEETNIEEILQYSFTGLTLLGEQDAMGVPIHPAVEGCRGELVKFSTANYEKDKIEFEKKLYNSVKEESSDEGSILIQKNKEEAMAENIEANAASSEVVENAEQYITTEVKVSTDVENFDDDGCYVGSTYEEHKQVTRETVTTPENEEESGIVENAVETKEDNPETDVQENAIEKDPVVENATKEDAPEENACKANNEIFDEELNALKLKCADLEKQINEKNVAYEQLEIKCNSLAEYKNNKEAEIMKNTIECELNKVSRILNAEQINEWRKKSSQCSTENVDGFINELKAFAFDVQEKNGTPAVESIRCSIPTETKSEPTDMWERIANTYK